MRRFIGVGVLIAGLLVPGVATADSGSITAIAPVGGGQFTATFTTTSTTCAVSYYCGWFPSATQAGVGEACDPYSRKLIYVGEVQENLGTQGPTTKTFFEDPSLGASFKICLNISRGTSYPRVNIGEAIYAPGTTAPAPATPTTPTTPATPTAPVEDVSEVAAMTIAEAKSYVAGALKDRYGSRFHRGSLTRACTRLSSEKVRCRVAWRKNPYRYTGSVTLWNDPDDPAESYLYRASVSRKRTSTSTKRSSSGGGRPAGPSCNPNYTGVCLPLSGDVDCGDISARGFRSIGSDPFRLDGDGDGIACES